MRFRLAERRSFVSVGHRLTNPMARAFLCFPPIRLLHLIEESFGILLMHSRSGWGQLPTAREEGEKLCVLERNFWPGRDAAVAGSGVGKLNESWAFVLTAFITKTNRLPSPHSLWAKRPTAGETSCQQLKLYKWYTNLWQRLNDTMNDGHN